MKSKLAANRSSRLVVLPVIVLFLLGGLVAAFFGQSFLAALLLLVFFLSLMARLWTEFAGRHLTASLGHMPDGLFPGDTAEIFLKVKNGKALPLLWSELNLPLGDDLCLLPEHTRQADDWEKTELTAGGFHKDTIGVENAGAFLWHQEKELCLRWTAAHRGIYSTRGWSLLTGDGFGLAQTQLPLAMGQAHRIAVYPALTEVDTSLFLRNQWNAETGARGIMEDPTVIRSTRPYQLTDPARRINWRLAARGLDLAVNVYEEILPRNVHFILDGDSFGGPEPHTQALEETLSILASELLRLQDAQVSCGLSVCSGRKSAACCLTAGQELTELLWALAAYQPLPPVKNVEKNRLEPRMPVFDEASLMQAQGHVGRFYYIALNTDCLSDRELFRTLCSLPLTLLTYEDPDETECEAVCIRSLKLGGTQAASSAATETGGAEA